jgi:AAA domain-containing protein
VGDLLQFQVDQDLGRFFDALYGTETGYVYSASKDPNTDAFYQDFFHWPTGRDELVEHVMGHKETREVYYAPALFTRPGAEKTDFKGSYWVWAEFDGNTPADGIPELPSPSITVQSSVTANQHWYWRLDHFETDISIVEGINKKIAYHANADLGCWNANRVLRPPTTKHHESGLTVTALTWDVLPVGLSTFGELPEVSKEVFDVAVDLSKMPEVLDVISKYAWKRQDFDFFKTKDMPKGHRSSALAKLGHVCVEMGMSNIEALAILVHADARWKKFINRNDRIDQLLNIVNYCRNRHPINPLVEEAKEAAEHSFKVYTWDEFKESPIQAEWLIDGLLQEKGVFVIAGPSGVGKSQLSLRAAESMAVGKKFLKWEIQKPMKVLFISMEMPHEELKSFTDTMAMAENEQLRSNLLVAPVGQSIQLSSPKAQKGLNRIIEEFQPDGIMFDSLGVALNGDLNDNSMLLQMFNYVKGTIIGEYGCFAWFIHHPRKGQVGNKKPNKLDDLYGGQYIGSTASTVVSLWPTGKDIELSCLKLRMAPEFDPFKIQRLPNLDFRAIEGTHISRDEKVFGTVELGESL